MALFSILRFSCLFIRKYFKIFNEVSNLLGVIRYSFCKFSLMWFFKHSEEKILILVWQEPLKLTSYVIDMKYLTFPSTIATPVATHRWHYCLGILTSSFFMFHHSPSVLLG